MSEKLPPLSLGERLSALASALVSGVQTSSLYPQDHPQVASVVTRFHETVRQLDATKGFTLGVTPDTLLVNGITPDEVADHVAQAARLLHERDIVRVTFSTQITPPALQSLLATVALDIAVVRARGGPATVWEEDGDSTILVEQIDYHHVLKDHDTTRPQADKDELWLHLVRAVGRDKATLSEAAQQRLLEIAGDIGAIGELTSEVIKTLCTPDGSPLITTQATAVLATHHHLQSIVGVITPERADDVARNLAAATAALDPHVVVEMFHADRQDDTGEGLFHGLAEAFDDQQVAQLLATTIALDGRVSERLAEVFDTIVPEQERKTRVVSLTRSMLRAGDVGSQGRFETLWSSIESLVVSHDERPFVSPAYRAALDTVTSRGQSMAAGAPLPPELGAWMETVEHDNVRNLSVTLLTDLLRLETGQARAIELVADIQGMAEDALRAGEYTASVRLVEALRERANQAGAAGRAACRRALDELGGCAGLRETVGLLDHVGEAEVEWLRSLGRAIGPAALESLQATLLFEKTTRARVRGSELIVTYGGAAVGRLTPLVSHSQWFVRRNTAEVLGRIAVPEAVPVLRSLLRDSDLRVLREATVALAMIDDPAVAPAIHTVLRAASGASRQTVIDALVEARDARVVPVLVRILHESKPLGRDHPLVLETLEALARLRHDTAVPAVSTLMRRRRWFARRRNRALKMTAVQTLRTIGTTAATAALTEASRTGDRLLKRIVQQPSVA